jgi:hypothetical protein
MEAKSERYRRAYMPWIKKEDPVLQTGTKKLTVRHIYINPFPVSFPERSEWEGGLVPNINRGPVWYIGGSKTNEGTGLGCKDIAQGVSSASALGNTPQYSRKKYMLLRHVQHNVREGLQK